MSKSPLVLMNFDTVNAIAGIRTMLPTRLTAIIAPNQEKARAIQSQIKETLGGHFPVYYDLTDVPEDSKLGHPVAYAEEARERLSALGITGIDYLAVPNRFPGHLDYDHVNMLGEQFELIKVSSIAEAKRALATLAMQAQGIAQKPGGPEVS